ncbi:MAG: hypothetical protein GC154_16580 [bacterium]|nr:hypothetical protein [bacterium]
MLWGKRSVFKGRRLKKPAVYYAPLRVARLSGDLTQAECYEHNLSMIRQHLLACRVDPYYGFFLINVDPLKAYLDLFPEERPWVTQLVRQERLLIGSEYAAYSPELRGAEAAARNLMLGRRWTDAWCDCRPPFVMNAESGPAFAQYPQLAAQCGIKAHAGRPDGSDEARRFIAYAPNGDWLFALRPILLDGNVPFETQAAALVERERQRDPAALAAFAVEMNPGGAPHPAMIARGREWSEHDPPVLIAGAAAERYFAALESRYAGENAQLAESAAFFCGMSAAPSALQDLAVAARLSENHLYAAEFWNTIAGLLGLPVETGAVEYAWRQRLFAQPGDLPSISDAAYLDRLDALQNAAELAHGAGRRAMTEIAERVEEGGEGSCACVVFNSLPWQREGSIRFTMPWRDDAGLAMIDSFGEEVPFEIERIEPSGADGGHVAHIHCLHALPAGGYTCLSPLHDEEIEAPFVQLSQRQPWLENDCFRLEIDPGRRGALVSLYDKELEKEWIDADHPAPANVPFHLPIREDGECGEFTAAGEPNFSFTSGFSYETFDGPLTRRLLMKSENPSGGRLIQEIRLTEGQPFIDCVAILENVSRRPDSPDQGELILAALPLTLPGAVPVLDDGFYARAGWRGRAAFRAFHADDWGSNGLRLQSSERWLDVSWSLLFRFMEGDREIASIAAGPSGIVAPQPAHRPAAERLHAFLMRQGVPARVESSVDSGEVRRLDGLFILGSRESNPLIDALLENNPAAAEFYAHHMERFGSVILAVDRLDASTGAAPAFIIASNDPAGIDRGVDELMQSTISHRCDRPASSLFTASPTIVDDAGVSLMHHGYAGASVTMEGALLFSLLQRSRFGSQRTTWSPNFTEQKSTVFTYRLYPHAGDWRLAESPRRALEFHQTPTVIQPERRSGLLPANQSFLSVEPSNIVVSAVKPAGAREITGENVTTPFSTAAVRLFEAYGEESNVWLGSNLTIKGARFVNLMEEPMDKRELYREEPFIRAQAHANEISTFLLQFKAEPPLETAPRLDEAPPILPVRYWKRNAGAAPEGLLPVAVSLRGAVRRDERGIDERIHLVELVLVNNALERTASGVVELTAPRGWRAAPSKVSYRLQGGASQSVPVHLIRDGGEYHGALLARARLDGAIVEDSLPIGPAPEFEISMTLSREGFVVHLRHNSLDAVDGRISLVVPPEAWPPELSGDRALSWMTPPRRAFHAPPGETIALFFPLHEPANRYGAASDQHWMIIKLYARHSLRYYHVRMDGRPSEGLGLLLP